MITQNYYQRINDQSYKKPHHSGNEELGGATEQQRRNESQQLRVSGHTDMSNPKHQGHKESKKNLQTGKSKRVRNLQYCNDTGQITGIISKDQHT